MKNIKIAIARLHRAHGLLGEIKLKSFFGEELLEDFIGEELELEPETSGQSSRFVLESIRPGGKTLLAKFEGIDLPEDAKKLTHMTIIAPRSGLPDLPEGQYYYEEIVGLEVVRSSGERLGELTGFFAAGEKDVWEVRTDDGGELLFPCVPEVLKSVDLEKGIIVADPMEMDE